MSPHLLTKPFPLEARLELARADAAAGRMTAVDAVELAAELLVGIDDYVRGIREETHQRILDLEHDNDDARREADVAEDRYTDLRLAVKQLARDLDERAGDPRGSAEPNEIRNWADQVRRILRSVR